MNFVVVPCLTFYFNMLQQIGDLEDTKAFILDFTWPETYPETAPQISLDAFFNNRMQVASSVLYYYYALLYVGNTNGRLQDDIKIRKHLAPFTFAGF